ncbi:U1 small nuclear ribonucleoprotein 70 kDa [Camellia lanceoleosa]|uniref:U1 small nuclear ribonucleoprotein 70 kDa n=1 Tax=Camellia lanceoleosa TaxID=1840588 RepID=A0ACC0ID74_9ERIC|nr:U1 small nuclear ribonucleoprotein 70 kDa [Camellia lanceoleosa]
MVRYPAVRIKIRLVTDRESNKPRGYAFIEYMHTRDMKVDGKKLDNRRVLVDVEHDRTVPNWRPRRLGGGVGTTRLEGKMLIKSILGGNWFDGNICTYLYT